jgi:DNA-binding NtrC family response regulator
MKDKSRRTLVIDDEKPYRREPVKDKSRRTLLVIDDEKPFCDAVRDYFEEDRMEVLTAQSGAEGLKICGQRKVDVILLDQKLPDGAGHALAPSILEKNDQAKIIFITAFPSFENAVAAVRMGAYDYLSKPMDPEELKMMVHNAMRTLDLEQVEQFQNYTREKERTTAVLVGNSGPFSAVLRFVEMAATTDAPVLITGETGTGKNLVAKSIHFKGPKARAAFVSINCAALPENLIEAELFGHEKGSFTGALGAKKGLFEMADGGTIFLDEIGDMPLHLQSKLLSVIEDRAVRRIGGTKVLPVSVRIIAATNAELEQAMGKSFRKDLYYRLSVLRIHIPSLREHRDDLPALCAHILAEVSNGRITELPPHEVEMLKAYDWPGNVRELRNILERSVLLQKDGPLNPSQLIAKPDAPAGQDLPEQQASCELKTLEQMERELIKLTLSKMTGNVTRSARVLGISLSTLKRKITEYGFSAR